MDRFLHLLMWCSYFGGITSTNDRVKRAERGCARAAEQVLRTHELMPFCLIAESESRVERTFSTFSSAKDRIHELLGMGRMDGESEGFGTQDLEANTELRQSTFSRTESAVMPFEEREWMEGKHTPETDLTKLHQVLEEGDKFESSFFRLDGCCFLALLRVDTLLRMDFLECTLIAFSW